MTSSLANSIDSWTPSGRVLNLRVAHEAAVPGIGTERAIHYTEFFKKEAEKYQSQVLRMAHALKYHLERRSVTVYPDEILVGSHTEHRIGAICHVELAGTAMLEDLFKFDTRAVNPLQISGHKKRELLTRVIPYWLSRNLAARAFKGIDKIRYARDQLTAAHYVINEAGGIAHFLPDYQQLINKGTNGLRQELATNTSWLLRKLAQKKLWQSCREYHANLLLQFGKQFK